MTDAERTLELFRFEDPGQSIAVEVQCGEPLDGADGRHFDACVVVRSGFVHGRVGLVVSPEDLDDWERCLDALQAGERAEWPRGERTAWVEVVPEEPVDVTVRDAPSTQIAVRMPIDDPSDWVQENRLRLDRLREAVQAQAQA
ncbi:hypothetical protein DFP74_4243 [Nocardiopsis sp. Huas11]|uniref:DUF5959 family protein n=1 Tax=Nocardiopsis sp. Huas11 TaxID=2183912 RepID=UPI000EB59101|nr:DUF5959 family protein [Nocardiopsis sp. Huas11]RKS08533.1 hypothetical protein DFP74_4243 [Nocardiopsis sp. Huas11]